jgi:DNA-binding protein HU-beta
MPEKFRYALLVDLVAGESGASKQLIHNLFVELVKEIKADLQQEGKVHLAGLGTFRLVWAEARQGRNPQTGEMITIPAHNRILFRPDAPIRRLINRKYEKIKPVIIEEKSEKKTPTLTEELEAAATVSSEPQLPSGKPVSFKERAPSKPAAAQPSTAPPAPGASPQKTDSPEPVIETKPPKPAVESPPVQPPVTVKVVRDEEPLAVSPPPPHEEKDKRKIPLWIWIIPILLVILLLFLFWPFREESQPPVAEKPTAERITPQPSEQTEAETPPAPAQPAAVGTPGGIHLVKTGDNLWGISTIFYHDAFLWPNILRKNLPEITNPDYLRPGLQINVSGLQGEKGNWTADDLEDIAEGYIHAYLLYHERDKKNAIHYLWVARNANEAVFNRFKDQINQADQTTIIAIKGRSRY